MAETGIDTEVPLNGLRITSTGEAGPPRIARIAVDETAQTLTLEFTSSQGATYAVFAGTDLISFDDERDDNVIGQSGTTTYVENGFDSSTHTPKLFYRIQRAE